MITSETDKINDELVKFCKKLRIVINEDIFNLGVKFGRLLEKNNLDDLRLPYFQDKDKESALLKEILNTNKSIDRVIDTIVKAAVTEQIEQHGDWEVGYGSYYRDYGKLDDGIANKFEIQLDSVNQQERNGDFQAYFKLLGESAKVVKKHGFKPLVFVGVMNSTGDECERIISPDDIDNTLYNIGLDINIEKDANYLDRLTVLLDELSKHYLLLVLKS